MLFLLSTDLINTDYFNNHLYTEKIKRAIRNVLLGAFESKHLVYAEDINVLYFFKNVFSDNDIKSVLLDVISKYALLNYDFITRKVKIIPHKNAHFLEENENTKTIVLSIDFFQDSNIIQPTIVLGENTFDVDFYYIISKYFCKKKGYNLNISHESDNGGGSSISDRYSRYQHNKNRFCLAFVDTDKKFPESPQGNTLTTLLRVNQPHNYFCDCFVIDVHEVENLVPFNYIEDLVIEYSTRKKILGLKEQAPDLLRYYDYKDGIKKSTIESYKQNGEHDHYANYYNYAKNVCKTNPDIDNFEEYYASKSNNDLLYCNLCRVLKLTLPKLKLLEKIPELLDFQATEWERIGDEFLQWSCARSKEALNI